MSKKEKESKSDWQQSKGVQVISALQTDRIPLWQSVAVGNQPLPSHSLAPPPRKHGSVCRKTAQIEASDGDVEGLPAVLAVFGRRRQWRRLLSAGVVAGGRGSGLRVELVVLVEVAVLHHAEAGGGAQVVAAALVLLDGLMQGPELAQQRHVLLTQTHLQGAQCTGGH